MESLVGFRNKFSITEEEEEVIEVVEAVVVKVRREVASGLLGKLLASKSFNQNAFKDTIMDLWQFLNQF